MKMNYFQERRRAFQKHIKSEKGTFCLYLILRAIIILIMIAQFFNGNYENVFLCVLTLILLMVPSLIEMNLHIDFPDTLEIIIMLFIFAAEILGEIQAYYITFPFWDTMLHTINGFMAAAIGFSLVDIFNRNEKFSFTLSPVFMAIVAFSFSMMIGVIWEFFEFGMDQFFHLDMQKDMIVHHISSVMLDPSGGDTPVTIQNIKNVTVNGQNLALGGYLDIGLFDTMKDLFVNFIGAVVFSIIGYFYVKKRGKGKVARLFIPKVLRKEEEV